MSTWRSYRASPRPARLPGRRRKDSGSGWSVSRGCETKRRSPPRLRGSRAPSVRRGLYGFAASRAADLIVIGASKRNRVARMLLGDVAREVLENPPCAVAVAPVGYFGRSARMTKIGVAYDGSPESEQALALARRIPAERRATLSAFEAVPAPIYAHDPWNVEGEIDDDVKEARLRVAALGDVEPHAEFADDAVEGFRRFGASVDLLVLGSHKYRPPDRLLNRSKSQRLADDPSSPLLVLSPAGRDGSDGAVDEITQRA